MDMFLIAIGSVFVSNFVLVQFLGICPFLGVSKKTESALGMGMGVILVMTLASAFTYAVNEWLLKPNPNNPNALDLQFLQTIVFIFIIAGLVQMLEMALKKLSPSLYSSLGVYLPLITTNCAILGVALLNVGNITVLGAVVEMNLFYAVLNGLFAGVGFTLAIFLLAGLREKTELAPIPKPFRGFPITLITACLMALAFSLFGMIPPIAAGS